MKYSPFTSAWSRIFQILVALKANDVGYTLWITLALTHLDRGLEMARSDKISQLRVAECE